MILFIIILLVAAIMGLVVWVVFLFGRIYDLTCELEDMKREFKESEKIERFER